MPNSTTEQIEHLEQIHHAKVADEACVGFPRRFACSSLVERQVAAGFRRFMRKRGMLSLTTGFRGMHHVEVAEAKARRTS